MEFLNPAALYAFFLLPLLLIPYLIRGRPKRVVFSSLIFLQEFASSTAGRTWGRVILPPIFFLQLLLLVLLILALSEPVFSVRPEKIAIVLDNSASMEAIEGHKSRFGLAQDEAYDILRGLSNRARVDLYLSARRLERVAPANLSPSEAMKLIRAQKPYDLGDGARNYGAEILRLAKEKDYERIFFLTDHPVRGQSTAMRVITVGQPRDNLAITSFQVLRPSFVSPQLEAKVEVTSFAARETKTRVSLKGGGKVLSSRAVSVAAGKSVELSFEGFPWHPYYEAEMDVSDALALDNHRFAVPPPTGALKILGISPRPQALESLRSISSLELKVTAPEQYQKASEEEHGVEIFHFSAPATLPRHHALFVLPPKDNPLVTEEKSLSRPVISWWLDPHPLTRYVNFALFRANYARTLKPRDIGEPIVQSPEGPLAMAFERQGYRYLVLGFDPFPYLGRQNLPVSIFTLNLLDWFSQRRQGSGAATGEMLQLGDPAGGAILTTPKGEKVPIKAGSATFSGALYQGLYQVLRGNDKQLIAVNLNDRKESDLRNPAIVELSAEKSVPETQSFFFSLWPYLLLLSILLLFVEWFLNPPATAS